MNRDKENVTQIKAQNAIFNSYVIWHDGNHSETLIIIYQENVF